MFRSQSSLHSHRSNHLRESRPSLTGIRMHPGIRARLAASTLLLAAIPLAPCVAQDDRPAENKNERRPGQGRLLENSPRPNQSEQDGPGRNRPGQLRPQDGRPGGPPNPEMAARGMAMMMRNFPIFKALDTDEDGQLSQSEIENASKSILKLDKNGDGIVKIGRAHV